MVDPATLQLDPVILLLEVLPPKDSRLQLKNEPETANSSSKVDRKQPTTAQRRFNDS